jgi:hypothetical protein
VFCAPATARKIFVASLSRTLQKFLRALIFAELISRRGAPRQASRFKVTSESAQKNIRASNDLWRMPRRDPENHAARGFSRGYSQKNFCRVRAPARRRRKRIRTTNQFVAGGFIHTAYGSVSFRRRAAATRAGKGHCRAGALVYFLTPPPALLRALPRKELVIHAHRG